MDECQKHLKLVKIFSIRKGQFDEWVEEAKRIIFKNSQSGGFHFSTDLLQFSDSNIPDVRIEKCKSCLKYNCYISEDDFPNRSQLENLNERIQSQLSSSASVFKWEARLGLNCLNGFNPTFSSLNLGKKIEVTYLGDIVSRVGFRKPRKGETPYGVSSLPLDSCKEVRVTEIAVSGDSQGRTWHHVSADVSKTVRLVEAFLSLNWECSTTVVSEPQLFQSFSIAIQADQEVLSKKSKNTISDTLLHNWQLIVQNTADLGESLLMFHQGAQLEKNHPSLALIAYAATLESIGYQISSPSVCPGINGSHCSRCQKKTGAMQAFREALLLIGLEKSQVRTYLKELYSGYRCQTVHEAKLFGDQEVYTHLPIGLIEDPNPSSQISCKIFRIREYARQAWLTYFQKLAVEVK